MQLQCMKFGVRAKWKQPTYDNDLWFFGSKPDIIPRWTGYTLGYDLVATYLKANPENSASKLATADASLFLNVFLYN